jgi:SAM-dependent methyltransferase
MDSAERFQFGENWSSFLSVVDESHIAEATARLSELLGDISGKAFLDIGSGSGIHSLAAVRLGASRVVSFDYDPKSVSCTQEMKLRFAPGSPWTIQQGSALDEDYLRSLGKFDIVYSWGVLHHTGDMWKALDLMTIPATGTVAICIYKDQGMVSRVWRRLKRLYVEHPGARPVVTFASLATIWGPKLILLPHRVVSDWRNWKRKRGMSPWHDIIDWAGGYPYEVASASALEEFYRARGFTSQKISRFGRIIQMNECVFSRSTAS